MKFCEATQATKRRALSSNLCVPSPIAIASVLTPTNVTRSFRHKPRACFQGQIMLDQGNKRPQLTILNLPFDHMKASAHCASLIIIVYHCTMFCPSFTPFFLRTAARLAIPGQTIRDLSGMTGSLFFGEEFPLLERSHPHVVMRNGQYALHRT